MNITDKEITLGFRKNLIPTETFPVTSVKRITYGQATTRRVGQWVALGVLLAPLLSAIPNLPLADIGWVIVGGESGPRHRPIKPEWVREIRDQCVIAGVRFFFKQWGGFNSKSGGSLLDGRTWQEWPLAESTVLPSAV